MTVSILLADDHPIVRQGLRHLLEAEADFRVVGEAADGLEAVEMADRLRPQVLIVDMMMPTANGLEVVRQVLVVGLKPAWSYSPCRVLMLML